MITPNDDFYDAIKNGDVNIFKKLFESGKPWIINVWIPDSGFQYFCNYIMKKRSDFLSKRNYELGSLIVKDEETHKIYKAKQAETFTFPNINEFIRVLSKYEDINEEKYLLTRAVRENYYELVEAFINNGAKIETEHLNIAISEHEKEIISFLLSKGAILEDSHFISAIRVLDEATIDLCIEKGMTINKSHLDCAWYKYHSSSCEMRDCTRRAYKEMFLYLREKAPQDIKELPYIFKEIKDIYTVSPNYCMR